MGYKARSITSKASSACKMNMNLVNGDRIANATDGKTATDHLAEGFMKKEDSPTKIAPAILAAAPAIMGALSKGKEKSGSGGGAKVVVNNSANSSSNSTSNSQASNAVSP